jgi:pantothenate kinase
MDLIIPAKFYCYMATRFLRSDIQSCQTTNFLGTSCLRKKRGITSTLTETQSSFYAHFKANKMPFPMTCYRNIFSAVMFSRSSNLTFDLAFLKMRYFNLKNILCACNYYLKRLQISNWDSSEIGFCEAFYCEESLHLY